ncbi:MAG: hypothetical protein IJ486_09190 [Firmicutes bacterium]|nr:hypothetical protein [Bacillota bacterium]
MERFQGILFFLIGCIASSSVIVLDDRMAYHYGVEPVLSANSVVRMVSAKAASIENEIRGLGSFYALYFEELSNVVKEGPETEEEPPTVQVFRTQKI